MSGTRAVLNDAVFRAAIPQTAAQLDKVPLDADRAEQARIKAEAAAASAPNIEAALSDVPARVVTDIPDYGLAIVDREGNIGGGLSPDGLTFRIALAIVQGLSDGTLSIGRRDGAQAIKFLKDRVTMPSVEATIARLGGMTISHEPSITDFDLVYRDPDGFYVNALKLPSAGGGGADTDSYTADVIERRDAEAYAASMRVAQRFGYADLAGLVYQVSHIIVYGQSWSVGYESYPALSRTPMPDVLMIGGSVNAASNTATTWAPVGGSAALTPMVGVVLNGSGGVMTDAEVAALAPGSTNRGETPGEGAAHILRRRYLDWIRQAADPGHQFLVSSTGVGGRTIEQLSRGADPDLFNRVVTAAQAGKAQADAAGKSYGVPLILWMQGEYNYVTTYGGTTDKDAYKALQKQLYADLQTYVVQGVAGQTRLPAIITYQTSGWWVNDAANMSVAMAQLESAAETPHAFLAASAYPVTDKDDHLDANGSRWLGAQLGKVAARILLRGEDWEPMQPTKLTRRGREVLITFHVPCPPMQFALPYKLSAATDYPQKGFIAKDDGGEITLTAVEIVGACTLRLRLARDPVGALHVWAGDKTRHGGNVCLRDSDPTLSVDTYDFLSGMYPEANIPALVGQPYPLHNWCVAGRWLVENEGA